MLCRTYAATASTTSTIESSIHPPLLDGLSPGLSTKLVISQGCGYNALLPSLLSGRCRSRLGRLDATEEGDKRFCQDYGLPHPILAVHDYLVVGPQREPVLAVRASPSLVL